MMKIVRYILIPFVPFYYLVTWLRNVAYDVGIKASKQYDFPVICVGNLSVGGTGKSPLIEYLIRLLKTDYTIATLSRGYKRTTTGFVLANLDSTAASIGDEPIQFYTKFKDNIRVAVNEDRQEGIDRLRQMENAAQVILLDDAFQHRKVKAGLQIMLSMYSNLYIDDWVLPTGDLREPRSGAKRADIIIVTKCPLGLTNEDMHKISSRIKPMAHQSVFFSTIKYAEAIYAHDKKLLLNDINAHFTLVTGIANAASLVDFLASKALKFEHLNFKDHYNFQANDIAILETKSLILTTEKDYMRLKSIKSLRDKLYYLPIEVDLNDKTGFNKQVLDFVKS